MDMTALFDLSYGVYVVGSLDGTRPVGCLANAAMQITAEPMTMAVSLNKKNYTEDAVRKSGYFTLTIMSEEVSQDTIGKFGFQSSKDIDKFEGTNWKKVGNAGFPVVDDKSCAWILCRVIKEVDVLTHTIFIGEIVDMDKLSKEKPMTYDYYHKVKKGKTSEKAPTYVADVPVEEESGKYVCSICGYTFEGAEEEFNALPDDWVCPLCKQPKRVFQKQ